MHGFVAGLQAQLGWSWRWYVEKWSERVGRVEQGSARGCSAIPHKHLECSELLFLVHRQWRGWSVHRDWKRGTCEWPRWIWQWFTFPAGCASTAVQGLKGESHRCMEFATTEMFPGFVCFPWAGITLWPRWINENISSSSTTAYSETSWLFWLQVLGGKMTWTSNG